MTAYVTTSFKGMIENNIIPDKDRLPMIKEVALAVDTDLRSKAAQNADKLSDDFVNFNFKRSWRNAQIGKNDVIGTDYDYYTFVVKEAKALWDRWVPDDYDPDVQGHNWFGGAAKGYKESLGIWQNKKEVTFDTALEGPQVDIGPKVDYGLFLERWNTKFQYDNPAIAMMQQIGVIHAIARHLQARWAGVHHIYAMSIEPSKLDRQGVAVRRKRIGEVIHLFPIIRIVSRHQ